MTQGDAAAPRRLRQAIGFATVVILVAALVFGLVAPTHIDALGLRAAVETAITLFALAGATLLFLDFRERRARSDVLLLGALATAALTDWLFSALPALTGRDLFDFGTGAQVGCQALVSVAFVVAALIPEARLPGAGSRPVVITVGVGVGIVGLASLAQVLADGPPLVVSAPAAGLAAAARHPVVLAESLVSCGLLAAAGIGFYTRPATGRLLLAAASFALAASRLQYLALPTMRADWVTLRAALRLCAYGLLLAVAVQRYALMRRRRAEAALAAERRRIARDLHDGLAQDLAYIVLQSEDLESTFGSERRLSLAARRALAASRGLIVDLAASDAPSTGAALERVGRELASRFSVRVKVTVEHDGADGDHDRLELGQREQVVRIAREAIVNAIQDGAAHDIQVVLDYRRTEPLLRISDDGRGIISTELRQPRGLGLRTMRERAAALGGRLVAGPGASGGTEVLLVIESTEPDDAGGS